MRPGTLIREASFGEVMDFDCPPNFTAAWFIADEWSIPDDIADRICASCFGERYESPAVAVLDDRELGYCARHMGGRRIEGQAVIELRLVAKGWAE